MTRVAEQQQQKRFSSQNDIPQATFAYTYSFSIVFIFYIQEMYSKKAVTLANILQYNIIKL